MGGLSVQVGAKSGFAGGGGGQVIHWLALGIPCLRLFLDPQEFTGCLCRKRAPWSLSTHLVLEESGGSWPASQEASGGSLGRSVGSCGGCISEGAEVSEVLEEACSVKE